MGAYDFSLTTTQVDAQRGQPVCSAITAKVISGTLRIKVVPLHTDFVVMDAEEEKSFRVGNSGITQVLIKADSGTCEARVYPSART